MNKTMTARQRNNMKVWRISMIALLSALSTVLMALSFSVPFMPSFIKMDFSELPALLASFAIGPSAGVIVCLVKNLVNLIFTTTGGIGELSNFLLGAAYVLPAGIIYRFKKSRSGALIASTVGSLAMGLLSLPINYFVTYPIYAKMLPITTIVSMYQAILPSVDGLLTCLVVFNMPYTFFKGVLNAIICFVIYKPLSPLIKGKFLK